MESNKRQAEADRRRYDELLHERDMLNKVCVCVCVCVHCGSGAQYLRINLCTHKVVLHCVGICVCTYMHCALCSDGCRP